MALSSVLSVPFLIETFLVDFSLASAPSSVFSVPFLVDITSLFEDICLLSSCLFPLLSSENEVSLSGSDTLLVCSSELPEIDRLNINNLIKNQECKISFEKP